ncbi:MAG TPA: lysozyme inhibitor LprI family protein [Pyrinomonadaceae bacterium]|nr:lysozyme inhibitor LprI family protein [Pyrinomonadaceae bacterium]
MKALVLCTLILITFGAAIGQKKKPDPCADAQSQAEMNICAGKEYKAADAELNQAYQKLNSMLEAEEKAQLKEAETAWIKYRDLNCDFVADQYKGGTIRPMILGLCLADVTRNRTTELKNQIKDRSQ